MASREQKATMKDLKKSLDRLAQKNDSSLGKAAKKLRDQLKAQPVTKDGF